MKLAASKKCGFNFDFPTNVLLESAWNWLNKFYYVGKIFIRLNNSNPFYTSPNSYDRKFFKIKHRWRYFDIVIFIKLLLLYRGLFIDGAIITFMKLK